MKYVVHPIQVHVHRRGDLVDAETAADRRVFSVCVAIDCQLVDVAAAQHAHGDV